MLTDPTITVTLAECQRLFKLGRVYWSPLWGRLLMYDPKNAALSVTIRVRVRAESRIAL